MRSTASARRRPWPVRVFFVLAFFVYTCVFPFNAQLNNPNENVRVYMTMAIVEDHTFVVDKIVDRHGWVNDMALAPDKAGQPHRYSIKGPATGYFGVPFYWAFTKIAPHFGHPVPTVQSPPEERVWWFRVSTLVMRLFVVQLPCFFFLVWFERWLRDVLGDGTYAGRAKTDTVLRLCAVAAVGFGTNYLAYALMFVSHTLFALAAFGSFGIITRERLLFPDAKKRRMSRALLAGFLAGLASLLEYHAFPTSCLLALYALTTFWRPTRLVLFGLGAAVDAGALMFYQWRCYGNPLTPGHKLAETAQFAAWHKQGFYGLGEPNFEVFRDLSLSHAFGFFGTSPYMWLGLLAIPFGLFLGYGTRRGRSVRRLATAWWLVAMFALWFAISCAVNWRGGWTVGPRFFGAAPPFFAFGATCALEWVARKGRFWRALARGVAGGLLLASVAEMGFVSLEFNSIPEDVTRPLAQIALPLARAGFVPHDVFELFGWMSPVGFYVIAACMAAAALVAAFVPRRDRWWTYPLRVVCVLAFAFIGIRPAFAEPAPTEGGGDGVAPRAFLARGWEPPGRDRVTSTRDLAERFGPRRPCLWYKLADLEDMVGFKYEAQRDAARAEGTPRSACP